MLVILSYVAIRRATEAARKAVSRKCERSSKLIFGFCDLRNPDPGKRIVEMPLYDFRGMLSAHQIDLFRHANVENDGLKL